MSLNDRITRVALARNICTRVMRLADVGGDECAVLDGFLLRLELGNNRYGPLDVARNRRDWDRESDEELSDWAVYRALKRLSTHLDEMARDQSVKFDLSATEDV